MRPLMVVNGLILGSCVSIAISLLLVVVVFLVLGDDYPRLQAEFRPLVTSMCIFMGMTVISAGSFYSLARRTRGRGWLQLLMWLGLGATGWWFWP